MELLKQLLILTSEVPEVVGLEWVETLTQFLNSTFGLTLTGIAGGVTGIITFLKTFFPVHKDFLKVNTAVAEVKQVATEDNSKIKELEAKVKQMEIDYNQKLALISMKSPNAKVKEFGAELMKQIEEKRKAIKLPNLSQLEETIKVLKEK
jgi:hypothetical protein